MAKVSKAQQMVLKIQSDLTATNEIIGMLDHPLPLVRVNALMEISERIRNGTFKPADDLVDNLVEIAIRDDNKTPVGIGFPSVAHFAIVCLFEIGTLRALNQAKRLINDMNQSDKADMLWFLERYESARKHIQWIVGSAPSSQ
jgi:hypothetical protein